MIDCLMIGQHDPSFENHIRTLKFTFGKKSGGYQDQDLTFVNYHGKPYRVMDLLNHVNSDRLIRPLSNIDFLWPAIPILASAFEKAGLTWDYINRFHLEKDVLDKKLREKKYRTVAISTTLYVTDTPIKEIIQFIKERDKTVKFVVGGPYIMNRCAEAKTSELDKEFSSIGADVYVNSSEGQSTLIKIIQAFRDGRSLDGISNAIFKSVYSSRPNLSDTNFIAVSPANVEARSCSKLAADVAECNHVFTKIETEDNKLEENLTNFDLFTNEEIGRFASFQTSKSCPYRCSFCNFPTRYGDYKYLDVDHVERQLSKLKDKGVQTISFLDDTFNVPKARFKDMLRMMIRNNFGFKWNSFYRSDQGDEELIELMAESGCEGVYLGMETASDKMLKAMNKTSRKKHYAAAVPLLRSYGIYTHANFIIGFPGETEETIRESVDFIREYKPDTYKAQLWYADPLSPIWRQKDELGIKGGGFNWSHGTMTSAECVHHIDWILGEIEDSVFLPQEGFGMWCIFYLQRLGMPKTKVLKFLQAFMAAVHRKRVDPERVELSSSDYELLKMLGTIENETDSRYSLYDQYFTGASLKGVVERSCEIAV